MKRVVSVLLLGVFLILAATCNEEGSQSITSGPTETQEVIEGPIITPTESPILIEKPAPTEIPIVVTSVPTEEIYPSPQPEAKPAVTPAASTALVGIPPEFAEQFKAEMAEVARKCPITNILPYGGLPDNEPFAIYPPTSPDEIILIEIDAAVDFQQARDAALDWIRSQGYDPENLGCEIAYRIRAFPK